MISLFRETVTEETNPPAEGDAIESSDAKKEEEKPIEEEEQEGLWEETFKSHSDSKPFGPTSVINLFQIIFVLLKM